MYLSEWTSFLLFKKKKRLEVWGLQVVLLLCLGFLFCCMTQRLLCCWYVALFSRSVIVQCIFYIYNKNNKGYFLEEISCNVFIFFFTWTQLGSGEMARRSLPGPGLAPYHPFCSSERWQRLISTLGVLKSPLWDPCICLFLCKAYICWWAVEAWSLFKWLDAPWALLGCKNQLTVMGLLKAQVICLF